MAAETVEEGGFVVGLILLLMFVPLVVLAVFGVGASYVAYRGLKALAMWGWDRWHNSPARYARLVKADHRAYQRLMNEIAKNTPKQSVRRSRRTTNTTTGALR